MKVVVVGCGRLGAELATRLADRGHEVAVIDSIPAAFNNLQPDFMGRTIEGEALNRDVLHRAGIEKADALAAVTNSDALNAVVAHIVLTEYGIHNIVVRNYDPRSRPMHEAFGLQLVSSTSWGAQRMEEMLYHSDVRSVFSAGNGEVEIYEFVVPESWKNYTLDDLVCDDECLAVSLARAGRAILPNCDTRLESGDVVQISATLDGVTALRARLNSRKEQ